MPVCAIDYLPENFSLFNPRMAYIILPMNLFLIGALGALGALARFGVDVFFRRTAVSFPVATLTVNLVGCFLVGFVFFVNRNYLPMGENLKLALIVGFLGGFTTFSAYGLQTFVMLGEQEIAKALAYLFLSPICGLVCVFMGWYLAHRLN